MPYKVGKKTSQGYPIKKKEGGRWKTVGHSKTKAKAFSSIKHREKGAGEK